MISAARLCDLTDASYRQIDYWCRIELIKPIGEANPGSGYIREFEEKIVPRVEFLVKLSKAFNHSFRRDTLKMINAAYDEGRIDLGDGIILSWENDGSETSNS